MMSSCLSKDEYDPNSYEIFHPIHTLTAMLYSLQGIGTERGHRIDKILKISSLADSNLFGKVLLTFYNLCDDSQNIGDLWDQELSLIIDLTSVVLKTREERNTTGQLLSITYKYCRLDISVNFEVVSRSFGIDSTGNSINIEELCSKDLDIFDYLMSQYSFYKSIIVSSEKAVDPNIVARGLEGTGSVIRKAIKQGGIIPFS